MLLLNIGLGTPGEDLGVVRVQGECAGADRGSLSVEFEFKQRGDDVVEKVQS